MTFLTLDCWLAVVDACDPFARLCTSLTCKRLLLNYCRKFCTEDETIAPENLCCSATSKDAQEDNPNSTDVDNATPQLYGDERDLVSISTASFDLLMQQRLAERANPYTNKASSSQAPWTLDAQTAIQAWDGKPCGLDFATLNDAFDTSTSTSLDDRSTSPQSIDWGEAGRSKHTGVMWTRAVHTKDKNNLPNTTLHHVIPNYLHQNSVEFDCQDASHRRRLLLIDDYWRIHIKKPLVYKSFITECTESLLSFTGEMKREYAKPQFELGTQDPLAKYHNAYTVPSENLQQWRIQTNLTGLEMSVIPVLISSY